MQQTNEQKRIAALDRLAAAEDTAKRAQRAMDNAQDKFERAAKQLRDLGHSVGYDFRDVLA